MSAFFLLPDDSPDVVLGIPPLQLHNFEKSYVVPKPIPSSHNTTFFTQSRSYPESMKEADLHKASHSQNGFNQFKDRRLYQGTLSVLKKTTALVHTVIPRPIV